MIGTTRYIPYRPGIVMMTVSNLNIKGGQSRRFPTLDWYSLSLCWMMICHISTSGSNLNRHAAGIFKKKDRFPPDWPRSTEIFSSYYYSFRILQVYTRWWKGEIGLSSSWAAKWTDDKKRKLVSSCERSLYRTSLREVAAAVLAIAAAAPILRRTQLFIPCLCTNGH